MKRFVFLLAASVCISAHANRKQKQPRPPATEQSIMVLNQSTNSVVHERNVDQPRSMASITKIMTAMVVLDTLPNLYDRVTLKTPYLGRRQYTIKEMLDLLLVRSDNYIAEVFSNNFLGGRDDFIQAMNAKARQLGMTTAEFVDPSGLNAGNRASARDVARMVLVSATYPDIRHTTVATMDLETPTKKGVKLVSLRNTNHRILSEYTNIVVSKTGTTNAAGKCVAMVVEERGQTYAVVIMGEPTGQHRDSEARNLLHNYVN